jgi:hypothetical protein
VSLINYISSHLLRDIDTFCQDGSGLSLRSYQRLVAHSILHSVQTNAGLTFVVIFPRQSGKNELQAQLEAFLLARYCLTQSEIVKVAPTWVPQLKNSMNRLQRVLDTNPLTRGRWVSRAGHIYHLDSARITFLSGSPTASVVGATASLLLHCDEAQSVLASKWDKDFAPMAASTNTTTVFWGTAWTSKTLLAREMRLARLLQSQDGLQRLFLLDAAHVAAEVPPYGKHLAAQISRLGRDHPLIKTQYFSEEIDAHGGMFHAVRQNLMQGHHPPLERPFGAQTYAFLIDVAGADEAPPDPAAAALPLPESSSHDATALTVVHVDLSTLSDPLLCAPTYRTVHRCLWTALSHADLYAQIKGLAELWKPASIVIDATGVGAGLASFLAKAYPQQVIPVSFSLKTKSELGWRFLAIVETGRYKEYASPRPDPLQEQFWLEVQSCRSTVLDAPGHLMRWGVPASTRDPLSGDLVHDDLLISAALCAYLDLRQWGTAESGLIPALDPLQGMSDVF